MKKRSLILITVDCLRADHVGFSGYSRPVTPFLDSLAPHSAVFSDAIVAGAPTYFSFPAIVASRYPLALGRDVLGIAPGEPTIATALRDVGYSTAAFLAGNPYLNARFGYQQGFDTFRDFLDAAIPESEGPQDRGRLSGLNNRLGKTSRGNGLTAAVYDELYFWYCQWRTSGENASMDRMRRYPAADVLVDQARAWLSGLGEEPFFLWLHFMDPHHPYYPPLEALAALGEKKITASRARFLNSMWNRDISARRLRPYGAEMLSLYDAGVYWVDRQISRLVGALQEFGRWHEAVFAVTADHGEQFLEHGERYHSPTNLLEPLIRVPLLLRAPHTEGRMLRGPFSLINLAPTLLDAVGIAVPTSFRGRSHWQEVAAGELAGEAAITECVEACNNPMRAPERLRSRLLAVRDGDYKLVLHFDEKTERLYDLKNDPEERVALPSDTARSERARLLRLARAHIHEARQGQKTELRLRARLREIRQSLDGARSNVGICQDNG